MACSAGQFFPLLSPYCRTCTRSSVTSPEAHHRVEQRQECVDLFLSIDNLDYHRQVLAEPQHLGGMQRAALAKAHRATQDRRARQTGFARFQDDRFVQGATLYPIVFANENSQQDRLPWNVHRYTLRPINCAAALPSPTAARHSRTEPTAFSEAVIHWPSPISATVSRLKVEKVVYPRRSWS